MQYKPLVKYFDCMADGRTQTAEEHTAVSAAKGNSLQLVPLLAVLVGLGILVYRFWWNTSALYAPYYALMACGIVAALFQLLAAIITTSLRRRKVIAIVDTVVTVSYTHLTLPTICSV